MGSEIEFISDRKILIQGKDSLKGTEHKVIPDRIEVGTYMIAGALIGKNLNIQIWLLIKKYYSFHIQSFLILAYQLYR